MPVIQRNNFSDPVSEVIHFAGPAKPTPSIVSVARDLDEYSEFAMTVLRALPRIKEMETTFVLREIKPLGALPLVGTFRPIASRNQ